MALTWRVVAIVVVTAYVVYELEHRHQHLDSTFARSFNSAIHQVVQSIGNLPQYASHQELDEEKKQDEEKKKDEGKRKDPPYSGEDLGEDPTKCPGKGFEWKGKGKPGSKVGILA